MVDTPERVVVIALLGRRRGISRASLYRRSSLSRDALDAAIAKLEHADVLLTTTRCVAPAPALLMLDALGMIGV
jgi:hypothetical protein